jgi:hypothetical protein
LKKILISQIPFKINPDTKILLERKDFLSYDKNYLEGPFYEDQNILQIIEDDNNNNRNQKKLNGSNNINNGNITIFAEKKTKNNFNKNKMILNENIKEKYKTAYNNYKDDIKKTGNDFIKIKKINPIIHKINIEDYNQEEEIKNIDNITGIYTLIKREHTYLRVTYEKYMVKIHPNIFATFLAEIFDKIYIFKIFIFRKKFDILSVQFALYVFYHILLLSLLCSFFTISVFKKIWEDPNFPTMNYYLLFGFLSNTIIWIIYKLFSLMLNNQDRIRAWVKLYNLIDNGNKNEDDCKNNTEIDIINEKYNEILTRIRIQTAAFYFIILVISGFCFTYLVSFFAVYTGTKKLVIKAYYISVIEIILIKFVYGFSLASLRIAAEVNKFRSLYNFVYFLDKHFS